MTIAGTGRNLILAVLALAGVTGGGVVAQTQQSSASKPILTITGKISRAGSDGSMQLSREALEDLGLVTIETKTPWYDDKVKFEGVPVDKLMKQAGASGEQVTAVALNDYAVEIPMEDFAKYGVILALKKNGEYMPVSDKGPLFLIYPYDSNSELQSQKFYSRSAWQVSRLIVK